MIIWGCSSVGRAPALQAGGQEFESPHLHHLIIKSNCGGVAQLGERLLRMQKVRSSSLLVSTILTIKYGLVAQVVRAHA